MDSVTGFLLGLVALTPVSVWFAFSKVNKKLDVVHVLVNSKMDAALKRIDTLEKQLVESAKREAPNA
jgi:hypothetical protein